MSVSKSELDWLGTAAVFGASGGIGHALCDELMEIGVRRIYAGARRAITIQSPKAEPFAFDLTDEKSISDAAMLMSSVPPELVIVASGALTFEDGTAPEKSFKQIDADTMARSFAVNTIGPALIAKHILPILPRGNRSVFAVLSARVGSIGDNRLGGWHSYRASKAALNMLVRNFAIELRRTHPEAVAVGLHPGTVDTALSKPFQSNLPEGQLSAPQQAARNLLSVIANLEPEGSGYVFDWKGDSIPA